MYDFIAIDFETATSSVNSACSIGIVCVSKFEIVDTKYFLIQPPENKYFDFNTALHGISPDMTVNAPKFPEIWSEIKELFNGDCIVVAHNARFDMSVLKACLDTYQIQCNDFSYIDSIAISNRAIHRETVGQSLFERAEHFGISIGCHHNALDDAIACAKITIASVKTTNRRSLKTYCSSYRQRVMHLFSELKPMDRLPVQKFQNSKIKTTDFVPTKEVTDTEHPLFGKNIVLTGELKSMSRKVAMQKICDVGGLLKGSVSSKTDYLIVGVQDASVVCSTGKSSKETKAYELKEKGVPISIINEEEFLKLVQ